VKPRQWLHCVDQTARGWRDHSEVADEENGQDTLFEGAGLTLSAGRASIMVCLESVDVGKMVDWVMG
jgi:hypothetical protein